MDGKGIRLLLRAKKQVEGMKSDESVTKNGSKMYECNSLMIVDILLKQKVLLHA